MVLKALILVGGYGTRLRPLTFTKSKPLTEFVNKPIILHQVEALIAVGVKHIILAVSYQALDLEKVLTVVGEKHNVKITFSLEKKPLGTAGPISLAKQHLDPEDKDPFFMLNADVIADYDFSTLLDFHASHHKEGTIYVTPVVDPSRYGVVVADIKTGQISDFVEKPKTMAYGRYINAGLYVLNKSIINRVKDDVECSIEREIFPAMAKEGQLYRLELKSYWMDVGKPDDYLQGQTMFLHALSEKKSSQLAPQGTRIIGHVVIHETAKISQTAVLGPNVVIGPNVVVGNSVRVRDSTIMESVSLNDGCFIRNSIIGWHSKIGRWARLQEMCVLGEDVAVRDEVCLNGVTICPHKSVDKDELEKDKIIL